MEFQTVQFVRWMKDALLVQLKQELPSPFRARPLRQAQGAGTEREAKYYSFLLTSGI